MASSHETSAVENTVSLTLTGGRVLSGLPASLFAAAQAAAQAG